MSTITLYVNRIHQMPLLLNEVKSSVLTYQTELLSLNAQLLTIGSSVCDVGDVIKALQASTQIQEQKAASIDSFAQNNDDFIAEVVRIDESAASLIDQRKSSFYAVYAYLMPNYEMSWIESAANWFVSLVEWCRKVWAKFWDWLSGANLPKIQRLEPIILSDLAPLESEQTETSGSVLMRGGVAEALWFDLSEEELIEIGKEVLGEKEILELNEKIASIQLEITEVDVVEKGNQSSEEAMFERSVPEVLARMIYQENHNCENGEQSKVLWVVVNRIFTDDNLTYGNAQTLKNVLQYGEFKSLTSNDPNGTYNAFHPDYNSEGWANAKFLAALLYALVKNEKKENLDENYVREALSNFQDLQGNYITNEIGDCDSFWGDGRINHFYIYSEGRNNE